MKKVLTLLSMVCFTCVGMAQDDLDSTKCLVTTAKITVNQGNKYTRNSAVPLNIMAPKAREMMVSNQSDFSGKRWQPFHQNVPVWEIDDKEDGAKTVYCKFRDAFQHESTVFFGDVTLDREPPKNPKVEIIQKKELSMRSPNAVELNLSVEGAAYMMISNEKRFYGKKWQLFIPEQPVKWDLGGHEDGKRAVFVKFRDHAANESEMVSDEVIIDTRAPIRCKLAINHGEKITTDSTGKVNLLASALGATYMMIANDSTFTDATWQPYDETLSWNIERKEGNRQVYIKFKDDAENISVTTMAEIFQDTYPPYDCSIRINGGAPETFNPDGKVTLEMKATDAEFMMLSNTIDFAAYKWQRFQPQIPEWRLAKGKGIRTVYAIFKDKYGNQTGIYEATIIAK